MRLASLWPDIVDKPTSELLEAVLRPNVNVYGVAVLLQGDRFDRVEQVSVLRRRYPSLQVIITGNDSQRVEEIGDVHLFDLYNAVIKFAPDVSGVSRVVLLGGCMNTSDQALAVVTQACIMNHPGVTIITSPYHQLRAFLTFLKVIQRWPRMYENVRIENSTAGYLPLHKEDLERELGKIKRYIDKGDVATIEEGLEYMKRIGDGQ